MTRLIGIAKQVGMLLLVELFVPGGTLVVLGVLFGRSLFPGLATRVSARLPVLASSKGA